MHVWLYVSGAAAGLTVALLNGASWSALADTGARLAEGFSPVLSVTMDPWLSLAIAASGTCLLLTLVLTRLPSRRLF